MPLIHSKSKKAFRTNVGTLMNDVGKSPHVKSKEQALAIAYETARRAGAKFAKGGAPMGPPRIARQISHEGFLHSPVPGRTDKLPISVKGGSYVLPADHVAGLGQGNSLAGSEIVNRMFKLGPYGSTPTKLRGSGVSTPKMNMRSAKFADGGEAEPTDIIAAGGEIVIPPEAIVERFGDLEKGHRALDKWVVDFRKKHIRTLRGLKPPKKD